MVPLRCRNYNFSPVDVAARYCLDGSCFFLTRRSRAVNHGIALSPAGSRLHNGARGSCFILRSNASAAFAESYGGPSRQARNEARLAPYEAIRKIMKRR